MKKYLMAAVALICMTMTCVVFAACSSDDDETEIVKYKAEPENAFGAIVCSKMDAALSSAFGNDVAYKRDDNKAIRVCDEVANIVREQSLIKTIKLKVTFAHSDPNADGKTQIVKTYTFPF